LSLVIVVLASRHDRVAASLVARWGPKNAALLTPVDLSTCGWRHYAHEPHSGISVIDGRPIPNDEIAGVLTRLAGITEHDLDHVEVEDRAYVASEMNAFLVAWLSALGNRVLNQASPNCLCGPGWRMERWVRVAANLGIPVAPVHRDSMRDCAAPAAEGVTVTVIGERTFGAVDSSLADQALRLTSAAGVALLDVRFNGPTPGSRFLGVDLCPDLSRAELADAVLDYFRGSPC
jgi:hypothetical protein